MQFIEALKLKNKLFFLFAFITVGIITIGVIGTTNINSIKLKLDSLYFGSLVPVTELNEILQSYHNDLAFTVYKAKNLQYNTALTSSKIENALLKIDYKWMNYEKHFKRDEELKYVAYTSKQIKLVNRYFLKILRLSRMNNNLDTVSLATMENNMLHINEVLKKLINYEVSMAEYERKKFLQEYDNAMNKLLLMFIAIILSVLIITYIVFKSIQEDNTQLENATKKLKVLNKKLENVSYTDTLTSMHNRRYFNMVYDRELKRAKRTRSHITFMMLDIDFFKQYNDTYGHVNGDSVLKNVSEVLKNTLQRPSDFVFRLGGEEFGVLLTQTDESSSAKLAREICDAIRAKKIEHMGSKVNQYLTISVGVVCCIADDALNDEILISRADEMLYEAKETGRDRYIITSNVSESVTHCIDDLTA